MIADVALTCLQGQKRGFSLFNNCFLALPLHSRSRYRWSGHCWDNYKHESLISVELLFRKADARKVRCWSYVMHEAMSGHNLSSPRNSYPPWNTLTSKRKLTKNSLLQVPFGAHFKKCFLLLQTAALPGAQLQIQPSHQRNLSSKSKLKLPEDACVCARWSRYVNAAPSVGKAAARLWDLICHYY